MVPIGQLLAPAKEPSGFDQPLEHLQACHRRIEQRLEILERAGSHWSDRTEEARDVVLQSLRFFNTSGVWHTADEEKSLFPRLRARISKEAQLFLASLESDHRVADEAYTAFKTLVRQMTRPSGPTESEAARYRALVARLAGIYRAHIAAEDIILTRLASDALDSEALALISREMMVRRGLVVESNHTI